MTGTPTDSCPNSPPTVGSRASPTNAPIQEENEDPQYSSVARSSINDLSLFSSPSMPNISLGRPHLGPSAPIGHLVNVCNIVHIIVSSIYFIEHFYLAIFTGVKCNTYIAAYRCTRITELPHVRESYVRSG